MDVLIILFVISGLGSSRTISIPGNGALVSAVAHAGDSGELSRKVSDLEATPSPDNLEKLIRQKFPECPDTMVKIARAESSFRFNAVNKNTNGTLDCGLFQINSVHGYDCEWLKNPVNNLEAARRVFDKQGLQAWSVYNYAVRNGLSL